MKRLRLTQKQYDELVESRDWCHRKGFEGMKRWYDEELEFHRKRRALPIGVQPEVPEDDRPRHDR